MEFRGIPWSLVLVSSSMDILKINGIHWNLHYYQEMFHGIPWNSTKLLSSSMEFHGTIKIDIKKFIIRDVYFIVSYINSCYYISGNSLVVEIWRHHSYKAIFDALNFGYMAICHHSKWRSVIYNGSFKIIRIYDHIAVSLLHRYFFNLWWHMDTIRRHRTWAALAKCLTIPGHYQNQ